MPQFRVKEEVRWTSSNTEKEGQIVAVVPPNGEPQRVARGIDPAGFGCTRTNFSHFGGGNVRDHESYLVGTKRPGGTTLILYWPRVNQLSHNVAQKKK